MQNDTSEVSLTELDGVLGGVSYEVGLEKAKENMQKSVDNLISEYLFTNGAFGNIGQQSLNESATGNNKKVFPNKETMANYYGDFINKHPATIPFYWIKLNADRVFKNPKKTKNKLNTMSDISEEQRKKTEQLFDICGLK